MIKNILVDKVPDIRYELRQINAGGCLLFAMTLKRALAKRGIKGKLKLVNRGYSRGDVKQFIRLTECRGINSAFQKAIRRKEMLPRYRRSYPLGHVALEVDGILYDSTGICKPSAISNAITEKTAEILIGADVWNHTFKTLNSSNHDIVGTMEDFLERVLS